MGIFSGAASPVRASLNDASRPEISASRSLRTSCRRIISFSRLDTERSDEPGVGGGGREMDRFGRGEYEFEGECELPWLENDVLRKCAEVSSCESD